MNAYYSIGLVALCTGIAGAATIPYVNDFSTAGLPNENPTAEWTQSGGVFTNTTGSFSTTSSTVDLTNAPGSNFVQSTTFSISALGTPSSTQDFTIGFGALGSDSTLSSSSPNKYYLADVTATAGSSNAGNIGRLRILSLGDNAGFSAADVDVSATPLAINTNYTLELTGTLNSGTLSLSLRLLDSLGTQIGGSATAADTSPLAGSFFGLRNRTASTTVNFDTFSVVPEPASLSVLALGVGSLLRRRR